MGSCPATTLETRFRRASRISVQRRQLVFTQKSFWYASLHVVARWKCMLYPGRTTNWIRSVSGINSCTGCLGWFQHITMLTTCVKCVAAGSASVIALWPLRRARFVPVGLRLPRFEPKLRLSCRVYALFGDNGFLGAYVRRGRRSLGVLCGSVQICAVLTLLGRLFFGAMLGAS